MRIAQRSARHYNLSPDYSNIDENHLKNSLNNFVTESNNNVLQTNNEKVLYFQGCMTNLTPAISRSLTSILKKASVNYEIMDKDGGLCCGRPMWMAGRLDQARQMVEKNREIIMSSGASIFLLSCPICYKIFKERYKLEGIEVLHHTEYIERLINEGRISISKDEMKYVYHDPCELGRGCNIYEAPRNVMKAAGNLVEAEKSGKESICCGGSLGSLTLTFDRRRTLTENALRNLTAADPEVIVTACPLCLSTFNRYADRPVRDIAEVINEKSNN